MSKRLEDQVAIVQSRPANLHGDDRPERGAPMATLDPALAEFVRALARANVARDLARAAAGDGLNGSTP
ncbi:hypothetical protein [uncultured Sphingomonas sp.]|uniref:hypothetical protein n=1 Tax=uncultured Sphingomonas sp. TaxID=158754 RepID=UPI0035CBEA25